MNMTRRRSTLLAYLLLAPLVLWLLVTIALPIGYLVYLSFTTTGILGTAAEFAGLDNFRRLFAQPRFSQAGLNTLLWIIGNGLVQVTLAFTVARLLYRRTALNSFLQVWIILPWVVPGVAAVIIWRWMLSSIGIVNYGLEASGVIVAPMSFFAQPTVAMATTVFINAWRWFPLLTVILLAALRNIPAELREAAMVDGATESQTWWYVIMPLLRPVLYVLGLLGTLWSANVFDVIWLLTRGGPSGGTTTLPVFIYEEAFTRFRLGSAAAASILMMIFLLVFVALFLRYGWGRELRARR
jgi:multiple sugar transport system permease protein